MTGNTIKQFTSKSSMTVHWAIRYGNETNKCI